MENNLEKIFEEVDAIDDHTSNVCVNCGARLSNDYTTHCEICGYDFEEPFTCPYQVSASVPDKFNLSKTVTLTFCQLTKKQCKVKGLDYEVCSVFRSLDSIKQD